MTKEHCTLD